MCHYTDILGNGEILILQLFTVASIAGSICFWIWIYLKKGLMKELWSYAPPIVFWIITGTLDIVITAKGAFFDPLREGTPLARTIFVETGYPGPVVASILWIALWAAAVLIINKARINHAGFFSLAVFYSLAVGHFFGFSSWFAPFCGFAENYGLFLAGAPGYLKAIVIGTVMAIVHYAGLQKSDFR